MKKNNCNIIEIIINDKNDIYNKFNVNKLSSDLGEYIYKQSLSYKIKDNVGINIKTKEKLSKEEENNIVDLIREYFGLGIQETLIYYKYNNLKKILFFILGIILISISHLISEINEYLFSEIILIIGWVAIWEVFENILFIETKKKFKLDKYKRLVNCKIEFID